MAGGDESVHVSAKEAYAKEVQAQASSGEHYQPASAASSGERYGNGGSAPSNIPSSASKIDPTIFDNLDCEDHPEKYSTAADICATIVEKGGCDTVLFEVEVNADGSEGSGSECHRERRGYGGGRRHRLRHP